MRRNIELYISNTEINPEDLLELPNYQRMDLFEEQSINITSSIKDIRDISKVFTDYSQQFNLPASTNNNKVFKHYYNFDIDGGFDARVKREALIKINGEDYRVGFITLSDVSMKNQLPYAYKVVFYGRTINLKRLFGDDELDMLSDYPDAYLNAFNHAYSTTFAEEAFTEGKIKDPTGPVLIPNTGNTAGDLCYPFVSSKSHYYYDTGSSTPTFKTDTLSRNVRNGATGTDDGLYMLDFKPAIRIYHIIKAIEEKYNITFSTDFFNTTNNTFYYLYLWLHREAGDLSTQVGESELSINLSEFTFTNTSPTGNDDPRSNSDLDLVSSLSGNPYSGTRTWIYYEYIIDITPTGAAGGTYSVEILDSQTGDIITPTTSGAGQPLGNQTFTFLIQIPVTSFGSRVFTPIFKLKTVGGVTSVQVNSLVIKKYTDLIIQNSFGFYTPFSTTHYDANYTIANQQVPASDPNYNTDTFDVSEGINIAANMPKMKVLDFLTSIFKMFNLTAFYDDRRILTDGTTNTDFGKIKVMPLDDFYSEGVNYDITEYIYTDKHSVSKANIYSEINLNYSEASTFAIVNNNEITGDEFGNERLNNRSNEIESPLAFDGGKYDVDVGFEHIMFERMSDQTATSLTTIQSGWMVSQDENPVLGKPLIFYCHKHATTSSYEMETTDGTFIDTYLRPANTLTQILTGTTVATENRQSIHFGEEIDEYFYDVNPANSESLFANYYNDYITSIYDEKTRLSKFKGTLPAKIITKVKLNDRLIISNKIYKINKMKVNINNGKADLELINEVFPSSNSPITTTFVLAENSDFIITEASDFVIQE